MPWEARRNGRKYHYRKRRERGRVVSKYFGAGETAELIALSQALQQEERKAAQKRWQQELAEQRALEQELDEYGDLVELVTKAALLASGLHQHRRQWRVRHGRDDKDKDSDQDT